MKPRGRIRALPVFGVLLGLGSLAALIWLYGHAPPRRDRERAFPPEELPAAAAAPEASRHSEVEWANAEQAVLAADNARAGAPEPPGTAALFRTAEQAVRAVLTSDHAVFARYGLPGAGIEMAGENAAEVSGAVAVDTPDGRGKILKYRVKILFLPGGYREALWPEFGE